jgi:cellulose synthase/poly-beta-1,6-N-acetylglucosamine synthase-like glycosyltransferase
MAAIVLFTLSAAFVVYVLFGYPFVLWVLTRRAGPVVRKQSMRATVSVLLPVRNGEQWIAAKLRSLLELTYPPELVDILVLSDGSTDGTAEIVKSFAADRVRLMELPPGGKAIALTAGLAVARGDILFFTDVRQRLEPDSLTHLVDCLADPTIGVVSGELVILEGDSLEEASTGLYWKYEKWIRTRLSQIDSIYGATGCIYAMRRELAVPIPKGVLLDDMYQPLAAFFRGYRVILDTNAKAYDAPTSLHSEFRRKVRTLAGVYQVLRYYPELLGPKNRMLMHFWSHKLGRLVLPWAMLTALVTSFWVPGIVGRIALMGQITFYLAALLDYFVPERILLSKVTSPIKAFTVLMIAAACAPFALLRPVEQVWKQTNVNVVRRTRH